MASKKRVRKKFVPKGRNPTDVQLYSEVLRALLGGVVKAVRLYDTRVRGQLQLEVDEETDE